MSSPVENLLVSGLHANETCMPLVAREVFRRLSERGVRLVPCEVPYPHNLLALIDHPAIAVTDDSMPEGGGEWRAGTVQLLKKS